MMKAIALCAFVVACGGAVPEEEPQRFTIPAGHCGVVASSDGQEMLIGTTPENLRPSGWRGGYSVSFEFAFYAEHVALCIGDAGPAEYCECEPGAPQ